MVCRALHLDVESRGVAPRSVEKVKDIDESPIREHGNLVADRAREAGLCVDRPRRVPRPAAVGRAREHRVAAEGERVLGADALGLTRLPEPIPHRVDVVRVERVGGDRLLVVEIERSHVRKIADERHRIAPMVAPVGRLADKHGGGGARGVPQEAEREANEIRVAVGGERDPRIRGSLVITAVRLRTARADAEGRIRGAPGGAAVVAHRGTQSAGPTERVAVLLVDADDVRGIRGIHRDPRLQFAIHVVRLPRDQEPGDVARSERTIPVGRRAGGARSLADDGGDIRPRRRRRQRKEKHQDQNRNRRARDASPHDAPPSDRTINRDSSSQHGLAAVKQTAGPSALRTRPGPN